MAERESPDHFARRVDHAGGVVDLLSHLLEHGAGDQPYAVPRRRLLERLLGGVGEASGVLGQRAIRRQLAEQNHLDPGIDAHQHIDLMAHGSDVFRQAGDMHLHAGDREGGHSTPFIRQHSKNKNTREVQRV